MIQERLNIMLFINMIWWRLKLPSNPWTRKEDCFLFQGYLFSTNHHSSQALIRLFCCFPLKITIIMNYHWIGCLKASSLCFLFSAWLSNTTNYAISVREKTNQCFYNKIFAPFILSVGRCCYRRLRRKIIFQINTTWIVIFLIWKILLKWLFSARKQS